MFRPLAAAAAIVFACGAGAYAQTGKVTVVTSFAKDVTGPFKRAFEAALSGRRPSTLQNRNTNAGRDASSKRRAAQQPESTSCGRRRPTRSRC